MRGVTPSDYLKRFSAITSTFAILASLAAKRLGSDGSVEDSLPQPNSGMP